MPRIIIPVLDCEDSWITSQRKTGLKNRQWRRKDGGRVKMATIQPKGEHVRQAVKWISAAIKEDENRKISFLIQEASMRFNLSPKDEEFLNCFYEEGNG